MSKKKVQHSLTGTDIEWLWNTKVNYTLHVLVILHLVYYRLILRQKQQRLLCRRLQKTQLFQMVFVDSLSWMVSYWFLLQLMVLILIICLKMVHSFHRLIRMRLRQSQRRMYVIRMIIQEWKVYVFLKQMILKI